MQNKTKRVGWTVGGRRVRRAEGHTFHRVLPLRAPNMPLLSANKSSFRDILSTQKSARPRSSAPSSPLPPLRPPPTTHTHSTPHDPDVLYRPPPTCAVLISACYPLRKWPRSRGRHRRGVRRRSTDLRQPPTLYRAEHCHDVTEIPRRDDGDRFGAIRWRPRPSTRLTLGGATSLPPRIERLVRSAGLYQPVFVGRVMEAAAAVAVCPSRSRRPTLRRWDVVFARVPSWSEE